MNIAVFCAYFYPHGGGVEKYVQNLFSNLKDIDGNAGNNINVTIITSNSENSAKFERKFGIDIYRFKCWNLLGKTYPVIKFSEHKKIRRLLSEKKFDYIITQTRFFNTSLLGCNYAKKFDIPLIHFEHGTEHSPIKNPIIHVLGTWYDHIIGRYIIKNSQKCVGISHASEEFIKHLYPNAKTICIYNSVDTKALVKTSIKDQKILRKSLGIAASEKVIVFVGRIIYAKGVQDLLEATKNMNDSHKVKVVIVGDGNYSSELKKNYSWAIYVGEQKNVVPYLSIADIFVNPSYAEGLPTSVLEAGAIGLSVVATDVGGTKEIIDDGVDGYLVKTKDVNKLRERISKILNDDMLQKKFSKNIQEKIHKRFDWTTSKKRFAEIVK